MVNGVCGRIRNRMHTMLQRPLAGRITHKTGQDLIMIKKEND